MVILQNVILINYDQPWYLNRELYNAKNKQNPKPTIPEFDFQDIVEVLSNNGNSTGNSEVEEQNTTVAEQHQSPQLIVEPDDFVVLQPIWMIM